MWNKLARSPFPQAFHATATLGSLLVSFGGTTTDVGIGGTTTDVCIGNKTAVYNIGACVCLLILCVINAIIMLGLGLQS